MNILRKGHQTKFVVLKWRNKRKVNLTFLLFYDIIYIENKEVIKMKLITILNILSKYGLDEDYPLWAEHDIVGFRGPSNIS